MSPVQVPTKSCNTTVLRAYSLSGEFVSSIGVPSNLVFGPNGNLYATTDVKRGVEQYNGKTGADMGLFASGQGIVAPRGLTFGPDGNLYVSNFQAFGTPGNVLRFNGVTGAFINTFIPAGDGGLSDPAAQVFGPDGNLYVADYFDSVVRGYNGQTGICSGSIPRAARPPLGPMLWNLGQTETCTCLLGHRKLVPV